MEKVWLRGEPRLDTKHFLVRKPLAWKDWSPGIHYAKYQTIAGCCTFPERQLYDFEIICVLRGTLVTEMRGERHVTAEGRMIFIPPGVAHRNEVIAPEDEREARLLGIHFDFDGKLRIAAENDMIVGAEGEKPDKFAAEAVIGSFAPLSENVVYDCPAECLQWLDRIAREFEARQDGYELICKGLMLNVLVTMMRAGTARLRASLSPHSDRIKRLIEQMEREPAAPWTVQRIAKDLRVNEDYAARLFRQVAGMPPGRLLRTIRHREARRLLRETDWSIETIGERVGYPDLHYFSRIFAANEGIPPREYRKVSRVL